MVPLSTRSYLKSNKLRPILNGQFCREISKNICLNMFGSKQPRKIFFFVIVKLLFRTICSCSNFLIYMENFDYRSILNDSRTIVHCASIMNLKREGTLLISGVLRACSSAVCCSALAHNKHLQRDRTFKLR